MRTAVILLWASCLYTIFRAVLCLALTASPWRRLAVLAVLTLAVFSAHQPQRGPEGRTAAAPAGPCRSFTLHRKILHNPLALSPTVVVK